MGTITVKLAGKLDVSNADKWYQEISASLEKQAADLLEIDCDKLEYISSTGLRKFLYIIRSGISVRCTNVSPKIYEIFDETGFTRIMDIQKKPRKLNNLLIKVAVRAKE